MHNFRCNDRERLAPLDVVADKAILAVRYLHNRSSNQDHLSGLCCIIALLKKSLHEAIVTTCQDNVDDESISYLYRLIHDNVAGVLELQCDRMACTSMTSSENLDSIHLANNLTSIFRQTQIEPQQESLLINIIEIISLSFDESDDFKK